MLLIPLDHIKVALTYVVRQTSGRFLVYLVHFIPRAQEPLASLQIGLQVECMVLEIELLVQDEATPPVLLLRSKLDC